MTNGNFRRTLVGAAVVAALGVLATPAGAAPYRGTFDPVDFAGEYIIDVNPACLAQGSGWYQNTGICTATLTSAFATVTSDIGDPAPTYNGTLTFAPPAISSSSVLFGIHVNSYGQLDGFDTTPIGPGAESPPDDDSWFIQFISGSCPDPYCYGGGDILVASDVGAQGAPSLGRGVYLFANTIGSPIASAAYIGVAQAIPEPGTLGLVLGALGGGWLARRRRKDKAADSG
jgi:hypothetical protein